MSEIMEKMKNMDMDVRGVCFDVAKARYKVYVDMFGVRTHLGYFSNESDAVLKRDEFVNSVRSSHYPLATFICNRFNCSFNKALVYIASALKAYVQRGVSFDVGRMFPTFTISFVKDIRTDCNDLVSVANARYLLSIQDPITDIIFGRTSISKFRLNNHLDYSSVINTLTQIANGL